MTPAELAAFVDQRLNELLSALVQARGSPEALKLAGDLRNRAGSVAGAGERAAQLGAILSAVANALAPGDERG